jgi:hypothetical protein
MSKSIVELEQDFYNHFLKMDKNSYGLIKIWKYLEEHVFSHFKESQPTEVDGGYPNPNTAETEIQRLNELLTEFAQIIDKKDREIESIKVCSEARKREILRIREESNEAIEQLQEQLNNQQQPTEVERMKWVTQADEDVLISFLKFIGSNGYYVEEDGTVWKNAFQGGEQVNAAWEYLQSVSTQPTPKEEDVENMALDFYRTANKIEITFSLGWMKIFEAGYNAAKTTK